MTTMNDILIRFIELIKEDPELRLAILNLINATSEAKLALAEWRKRRG